MWDRRFTKTNEFLTHSATAEEYVKLYSGPKFSYDGTYPNIMNAIMVSLMYGVALPILFPLTLVQIALIYILDKILIVFYMKKPDKNDGSLNKSAVFYLKFGAILYACIGYWILTNR